MPIFGRKLLSSQPLASAAPPQRLARSMGTAKHPREIRPESITVAIFCSLLDEVTAVRYSLDEEFVCCPRAAHAKYVYNYGRIGHHAVVIARPFDTGPIKAARVAATVSFQFPNVRNAVLVGTGGGIPYPADIRLGDIAVSMPGKDHPGVIQYDFGKYEETEFVLIDKLDMPSKSLLSADKSVQRDKNMQNGDLGGILGDIIAKSGFKRPTTADTLFHGSFDHVNSGSDCSACRVKGSTKIVPRPQRRHQHPVVHRGLILSGSGVVRNPRDRDILRRGHNNAICFETEAAGIVNEIPCIVVRGISNYADTHVQDGWHRYAAAASAAYCKALLYKLRA
ncbi:nucleoside phosphorylase domain-containing protein [Aspergillus granulosus]|uniref:Nucleoside phosphorylase domain-containing protein n=1 Tax=Aspergillus granulosus TaxID=176169 RepID=A0ABR4HGL2_9EURO